jgi:hypothetical protein
MPDCAEEHEYTRASEYEYVLELDAAGAVIDGVWIGKSRTAHPRRLSLPGAIKRDTVVAGITYANVKALLDASVSDAPTK